MLGSHASPMHKWHGHVGLICTQGTQDYRIHAAKRSDTRARRIERFVALCARGETIHPPDKAK